MARYIRSVLFVGSFAIGVVLAPLTACSDEACLDSSTDAVADGSETEEPLVSESDADAVEEKTADPLPVSALDFPLVIKPRALFQHATYPAAWKAAQKSNRPILVFVSMPNCHYCVKMKQQVYQLPHVKDLVSNSFETIKADRFAHAKLVSSLKIKLYPTTVLVGPNNKILDVIEGFADANMFQRRLQTGIASATNLASATTTR